MSYAQALEKGWADLMDLTAEKSFTVKFLSDSYSVDAAGKQVLSDSCNVPAKEHVAIIALHYLIRKLTMKTLPNPSGEWVDFNNLDGGEVYYPAFKKRTIDQITAKFGGAPELLPKRAERFPSKKSGDGDASVIIYPFEETPVLIKVWKADDEFGPDANILFDKTISGIFCMEDIVVLTEIMVHQL